MTDVQDRAFLLPAVPRINYIAVVPEHDRDKDRGSEMDLRTALKWTARRRMKQISYFIHSLLADDTRVTQKRVM